ncbi:MAG TPA: hypothetical protein VIC62_13495, partial [Nakamurella sp.]
KHVCSGGTPNTHDDGGTLTSNVVAVPTAVPAQVFGDAIAGAGNSGVNTDSTTVTTAGGPPEATGRNATGAGNIVYVPSSAPTQAFGDVVTLVGNGNALTTGNTTSTAGGDASSTGSGGSVSGNVVEVSSDIVNQLFGNAISGVGIVGANGANTTDSHAGGDVNTTGDFSSLSGNAVAVPDSITDQWFGNAVAAGSNAWANATNDSNLSSGGQLTSTAIDGAGSGNVLAVPLEASLQVFGNAVAALGHATGLADNESVVDNGGDTFTDGFGPLSAYNFNDPLGADVTISDLEVEILGTANTMVEDNGVVNNGFTAPDASVMSLPVVGGLLGAGTTTPGVPDLAGSGLGGGLLGGLPATSLLSALTGGVPGLSGLTGGVSGLTGAHPQGAHAQAARVQAAPAPGAGLPGVGTPGLGSSGLGSLPSVPKLPLVTGALGKAGELPVQHLVTTPAGVLQAAQTMGHGAQGISGVLPVQRGLFPRV